MLSFKYIIIPIFVTILAQTLKVIIDGIKNKRFSMEKFFRGMGGMPSAHSSLVSSISVLIFLDSGATSSLFALSLIISLIVIYDAMGIRYESGLHAREINKLANTSLMESLGHKPLEVTMGILFGIVLTLILNMLI